MSIFDTLQSERICPNVNLEQIKFKQTLSKVTERTMEHIRFTTGAGGPIRIQLLIMGPPKSGKTTMEFLLARCMAISIYLNFFNKS